MVHSWGFTSLVSYCMEREIHPVCKVNIYRFYNFSYRNAFLYVTFLNTCISLCTLQCYMHFDTHCLVGEQLCNSAKCKFGRMGVLWFLYHFGKHAFGKFAFKCEHNKMSHPSLPLSHHLTTALLDHITGSLLTK